MDLRRLGSVLERAERTPCEGRDYEGLSLGEPFRAWPEEILTGRAVRGRANTDAKRMVKAYAKAMHAVSELSQSTHGIPWGRNVPLPRDDARGRPELPNNFMNLPLADAMIPFDATLVPPQPAPQPPRQDGAPDEQHRNALPGDRRFGRAIAWSGPAHVLRPRLPAAFEQQMMESLRSQGLTRLPGHDPPASLQGRLRITSWGLQRPAWPILQSTERVRPDRAVASAAAITIRPECFGSAGAGKVHCACLPAAQQRTSDGTIERTSDKPRLRWSSSGVAILPTSPLGSWLLPGNPP